MNADQIVKSMKYSAIPAIFVFAFSLAALAWPQGAWADMPNGHVKNMDYIQLALDPDDLENESAKPKPAAPSSPAAKPAPGTQPEQAKNSKILTEKIRLVQGPKRVVAVGKFDAIGAFKQKYGDWDVGGGVSAMLSSALKESGRFIVLERANVNQILSEQQLKGQKLVHKGSGPKMGKIIGVNLMIYGSVTEFGADDEGGGFSIGGSGGGIGNLLSGALSSQSTSGRVAMDIRIVDTTTTEILEVYKVAEDIESSSFDLNLGVKGINLGGNKFLKTPLGQAVRKALTRAVQKIAGKANQVPWSANVVEFDKQEVYINAGARSGLSVGDKFQIQRVTKVFTDPNTGLVLGKRQKTLGMLELTGVEPKLAFGTFLPLSNLKPQRGDMVVLAVGKK